MKIEVKANTWTQIYPDDERVFEVFRVSDGYYSRDDLKSPDEYPRALVVKFRRYHFTVAAKSDDDDYYVEGHTDDVDVARLLAETALNHYLSKEDALERE